MIYTIIYSCKLKIVSSSIFIDLLCVVLVKFSGITLLSKDGNIYLILYIFINYFSL